MTEQIKKLPVIKAQCAPPPNVQSPMSIAHKRSWQIRKGKIVSLWPHFNSMQIELLIPIKMSNRFPDMNRHQSNRLMHVFFVSQTILFTARHNDSRTDNWRAIIEKHSVTKTLTESLIDCENDAFRRNGGRNIYPLISNCVY